PLGPRDRDEARERRRSARWARTVVREVTLRRCSRTSSASFIADRYALGDRAMLTGPVARGELGQVWRLITSNGTWAVKEPFEPKSEADSREEAQIQEIARDAGIPAPRVLRSADGDVSLVVGDVRI